MKAKIETSIITKEFETAEIIMPVLDFIMFYNSCKKGKLNYHAYLRNHIAYLFIDNKYLN